MPAAIDDDHRLLMVGRTSSTLVRPALMNRPSSSEFVGDLCVRRFFAENRPLTYKDIMRDLILAILVVVFCASVFLVFRVYGADFRTEDVKFVSNDVQLSGSIIFPKDKEVLAGVVFVHWFWKTG
jgi:hypothetical protein